MADTTKGKPGRHQQYDTVRRVRGPNEWWQMTQRKFKRTSDKPLGKRIREAGKHPVATQSSRAPRSKAEETAYNSWRLAQMRAVQQLEQRARWEDWQAYRAQTQPELEAQVDRLAAAREAEGINILDFILQRDPERAAAADLDWLMYQRSQPGRAGSSRVRYNMFDSGVPLASMLNPFNSVGHGQAKRGEDMNVYDVRTRKQRTDLPGVVWEPTFGGWGGAASHLEWAPPQHPYPGVPQRAMPLTRPVPR